MEETNKPVQPTEPEETPDFDLPEDFAEEDAPEEVSEETSSASETDSKSSAKGEKAMGISFAKEVFEWIQAIVVAVVVAMTIRTFFFTLVNVDGASMEPTLHDNDRLFVTRLAYTPEKGDIIIFRPDCDPDRPYVKRVIAMPGDTIDINEETGDVSVNGEIIDEPYIKERVRTFGNFSFPAVVPENHVFVMGDNRNHSKDSRFQEVGMVSYDSIIGKATFRFWPFEDWGTLYESIASPADEA